MRLFQAAALAALVATASAQLTPNTLPAGFCGTQAGESGYALIDATTNKNYFYFYSPAQNAMVAGGAALKASKSFLHVEDADASVPVFLWLTGGPGCSSTLAMLSENGPCSVTPDGAGTVPNPNTWTSQAHGIWLDQPAGVGFSYANDNGYDSNEAGVAKDAYTFLQGFFSAHPELLANPFYVVGESYGGHYAPSVARAIFDNNANLTAGNVAINLQGLAVGNGLTDPVIQYQYYAQMAYNYSMAKIGHPAVNLQTYQSMVKATPTCVKLTTMCQSDTSYCPQAQSYCNDFLFGPYSATGLNPYNINITCAYPPLCYDMTPETTWLNDATVQATLGVAAQDIQWQPCNFEVNSMFSSDWSKDFQEVIPPMMAAGVRTLIYAGDLDYACNWLGNQAWTLALDWSGSAGFNAAAVQPWMVGSEQAGEVRSYETFNFVRVFDAGHMVPSDKPVESLALMNAFFGNQPLTPAAK